MKNRILIFSIAYEPLIGGAELAARNITDRLPHLEFDLITCRFSRHHKSFERIGNVNVWRVGYGTRLGRYLYSVFAFRLAKKLHREHAYQVIWLIMAAYGGPAALMFKRRFPGVKFLLTLQEGDPIREHIHKKVRGFRRAWQQIFRRADYITAISRYLADWAKSEGATCPVEVVPNGVDLTKFKSTPSSSPPIPLSGTGGESLPAEARAKGGEGEFKIITTSRLVYKNGIDILLKALSNLKSKILNLKLQIAGIGPEEKKLKALTKRLDLEENIEFLGDVKPDKIPEYLSQADIFVRPSRSEGLGTAFLEAMAAGLPVIGTPVGGIVDFLHPLPQSLPQGEGNKKENFSPTRGEEISKNSPPLMGGDKGEGGKANGLFVKVDDPQDLAEKIKLLIEAPELRIKLGQNGRRLIEEKYNWDNIAERMDKVFKFLIPN